MMDLEQAIPKPDLFAAKVILAVQPHYDDNDIGAGGTLAALAEAGASIYYLTVTDNLTGVIDEHLTRQEATKQIRQEQAEAGAVIGVRGHYWLEFPDAGPFDYFELRRGVIQHIRMLKPDLIFTVDPWTPYEVHQDHSRTGLAAAESVILANFPRLSTVPEVDASFQRHELQGIVFYNSWVPNTYFDITQYRGKKHAALNAYRAQFSSDDLQMLHLSVEMKERYHAEQRNEKGCSHAEGLKVLNPILLHCVGETWKL